MAHIEAVLFDVDGTLIDSNGAHALSWSRACRDSGFDLASSFFRPLIGMGGDRIFPLISAELSADTGVGKLIARRRAHIFETEFLQWLLPTPGAAALVEYCAKNGMQCVVATSSAKKELDSLLDIVRVTRFMNAVGTVDDVVNTKPAPDVVSVALRKAGVPAERAVFIGDTPYDVEAGTRAGVAVIALRSGGWDDAGLVGAAEIYDDPADLLSRIHTSRLFVADSVT